MYRGFNRQRAAIPANQMCELKYEDLVRDPMGQLRRIYEQLGIGRFRFRLQPDRSPRDFAERLQNQPPRVRAGAAREIRRRWSEYFEQYGYE